MTADLFLFFELEQIWDPQMCTIRIFKVTSLFQLVEIKTSKKLAGLHTMSHVVSFYSSLRFWMFLCYPLYGCGEGGGVLVS